MVFSVNSGFPLLILYLNYEEVIIHQSMKKRMHLGCCLPKPTPGEMHYSNWSLGSVTFPLWHLLRHLGSHWSLVAIIHWYTLQPLRYLNPGDVMNVELSFNNPMPLEGKIKLFFYSIMGPKETLWSFPRHLPIDIPKASSLPTVILLR